MSSVQIWHRNDNYDRNLVSVIDGDRIRAHSGTIRAKMLRAPPRIIYRFTVHGASLAAFQYVLSYIERVKSNRTLFIPINHMCLPAAVDTHLALAFLEIEPWQDHVEGHINGYLSHSMTTPEEMELIRNAYGDAVNDENAVGYKQVRTMINTTAFHDLYDHMSDERRMALRDVAAKYPSLKAAIDDRIGVLQKVKKNQDRAAIKRAAKKAPVEEDDDA